jgi:hypothetical protein
MAIEAAIHSTHFRRWSALWIRVLLLALFTLGATHAANTVITFNDLSPNTVLTNQYDAMGVDFVYPPESGQIPYLSCCGPITRVAPPGHDSQVVSLSWHSQEIFQPAISGVFTSFRSRIQITVGDSISNEKSFVNLSAYDINGMLVGQSGAQTVVGGMPPVTLVAAVNGAAPTIAFFVVLSSTSNTNLWADDLTFDNPAGGTPDFSIGLAGGGAFFTVVQGGSASETIPINRFNGSNGNITFSVSGLPQGVTASFSPNPIIGGGLSTTLTLQAAIDAPLVTNGTFNVAADPKGNYAVGPQVRTAQLPINVYPAFVVSSSWGVTFDLPPCTPAQITNVQVTKYSPAIGDVTLALRVAGPNGTTLPLPNYMQASFVPPVSTGASTQHTLTISIPPGYLPSWQSIDLVVQGTSGSDTVLALPFTVRGVGGGNGVINSVTPASGRIPQRLQPGTQVTIKGQGFCTPLKVEFGNTQAVVPPDFVSSTEIKATVPQLATSGPITLPLQTLSADSAFFVDSFRNTAGFSFQNYIPDITYGQYTEAFGDGQTYDSIDLCWPFGCNVSFKDPTAWILYEIVSGVLGRSSGGGACFGFGLASRRVDAGQRSRSDFPSSGASDNFALSAPNAPSGAITDYINSQSTEQASLEFLAQWLGDYVTQQTESAPTAMAHIHAAIQSALSSGEPPLISLLHGTTGHIVTAWDLKDNGPNDFTIFVYDPNLPFVPEEDSDDSGVTHQSRMDSSVVHVTPDGNWTLNSSSLTGDVGGLFVVRASSIPVTPSLPGISQILSNLFILFGSANSASQTQPSRTTQLADSKGHKFYDSQGNPNSDPATLLKAAPFPLLTGSTGQTPENFLVSPDAGPVVLSLAGTASGPDTHGFIGAGFAVQVDTQAASGISDSITFDPSGTARFQTQGATKPLTISLNKSTGGVLRGAQLTTTSFAGAADELQFDQTGSIVTFRHSGAASSFRLQLMSRNKNSAAPNSGGGPQTIGIAFDSGNVQIGPGQTATFNPVDWNRLDTVDMTIRDALGGEVRQTLTNQAKIDPWGGLISLTARQTSKIQNIRELVALSNLGQIPSNADVTLSWTITDATGKTISHQNQTLAAADLTSGQHTYYSRFVAGVPGDYTVRASMAIVTADSVFQAGQASSGSATITIDTVDVPPGKCVGICQ